MLKMCNSLLNSCLLNKSVVKITLVKITLVVVKYNVPFTDRKPKILQSLCDGQQGVQNFRLYDTNSRQNRDAKDYLR